MSKRVRGHRERVGAQQRVQGQERVGHRERVGADTAAPPEHHGHGLLHVVGQGLADLKTAAIHSPAGLYETGKALVEPTYQDIRHGPTSRQAREARGRQAALAKGLVTQTAADIRHPLRHPGFTALDLLALGSAGAGTAARVGAAGHALGETGEVGRALKTLATKPQPAPRTLRFEGAEVKLPASRNAATRGVQRARDRRLMRQAAKGGADSRAYQRLAGKVGRQLHLESEVGQKTERVQHVVLRHFDKKLSAPQKMAIRIVAEGRPAGDVLKFHRDRITELEAQGGPKARLEIRRHEQAHKLVTQAERYVRTEDGKPVFRSGAKTKVGHLGDVYARAQRAEASTEKLLGRLGFSPEGLRARKQAPGRIVSGEHAVSKARPEPYVATGWEGPEVFTNAVIGKGYSYHRAPKESFAAIQKAGLGVKTPRADEAGVYLGQDPLQARSLSWKSKKGSVFVRVKRSSLRDVQDRAFGEHMTPHAVPPSDLEYFGADLAWHPVSDVAKQPPVPTGSELYLPGTRKPGPLGGVTLSPRGTVGIPRKPSSLAHIYTGKSKVHALERPDVLNALGEHGIEVHRYAGKLAALDALKPLGRTGPPTTAGWRFIRTDTGQLGPETRNLVDRIDRGEQLGPQEGMTLAERVKEAGRNALTAGRTLAADEQAVLAKEGKGMWVPEKAVKPFERAFAPRLGGPGMTAVDEVNNAMKIATLYLKPAYAVPNLLGNVALNLVQQGFAAPANLGRAVRLAHRVDTDTVMRIDELMGEGVSGALRGQGGRPAGRAASYMAGKWSKVVDRVPRRAAFLYEAKKAGYGTRDALAKLTGDPSLRTELAHVTERANKEMIDYGHLSPVEQNVLRRVIYFYPWVRGATRYAGRLATEHPVAAAAAGELGQEGQRYAQQTLGQVPYYLEGSFGVGNNRLLNPTAAAILQTPAQVGEAAYGLATGRPDLPALTEFGSPVAELALAGMTGRSSLGIPLAGKGGPVAQSALQQVRSLPVPLMAQRIQQARAGEARDRVFPPDVQSAILLYLLGGAVTPRRYNPQAMRDAYLRSLRPR